MSSARTKDGMDVPGKVNYNSKELKFSEPAIWNIRREFLEDPQKIGMDRKMNSTQEFNVYTEVPIEQTTEKQRDSAIDLKWVKCWKTKSELRMRLVARRCFQKASKLEVGPLRWLTKPQHFFTHCSLRKCFSFLHLSISNRKLKQSPQLWQPHFASVTKKLDSEGASQIATCIVIQQRTCMF